MLTSKQRAILRGKANTMDPVFIVGKGEIDETMIQGVKDCLDARELIKLKVLESSMYNAREASVKLAEVLAVLRAHRLEPKRLAFVKNRPDAAPWLFLVEAQKNRRTGLRIEPDVLITAGAAMYGSAAPAVKR